MSEETKTARDGKRGCPVTVWDGPYSTRCGAGASVGKCAHHGPFATALEANDYQPVELTKAEAAARREALLGANKKHGYELARAWVECAEATSVCECSLGAHLVQPLNPYRAGLAEPERDEEVGR